MGLLVRIEEVTVAKGKRVSVTLDEGLWAWTKVNAEKRRWSRSKFIMQIVRNARKREEEEHKKKPSWLARLWKYLGNLLGTRIRLHIRYRIDVHQPEDPSQQTLTK